MQLRSRDALVICLDASRLSEREVARRAELGHATVNHLVTGRRTTCTLRSALDIERVLQVEPGTLFTAQTAFERAQLAKAVCTRGDQERSVMVLDA